MISPGRGTSWIEADRIPKLLFIFIRVQFLSALRATAPSRPGHAKSASTRPF